ncbi:hypothetical protein MYAM1_002794 [Malassezia yamatoensis]|uniref:Uncharacterized protein n=1 Tax=Malassezia yamatoensis TaxID=253288 RepID=A0AAJ6CHA1_9BASI|nr:hypothetical protein MYAM1_002794 [Malassezia yamatoensis]
MSKSGSSQGVHNYKTHFTRTRLAFDRATARQMEIEASVTKAMQVQHDLQEEVECVLPTDSSYLLDALLRLQPKSLTDKVLEPPPTMNGTSVPLKGRNTRMAVVYSDDDDDDRDSIATSASGTPQLNSIPDQSSPISRPLNGALRPHDTPPASSSDIDEDVLGSIGEGP